MGGTRGKRRAGSQFILQEAECSDDSDSGRDEEMDDEEDEELSGFVVSDEEEMKDESDGGSSGGETADSQLSAASIARRRKKKKVHDRQERRSKNFGAWFSDNESGQESGPAEDDAASGKQKAPPSLWDRGDTDDDDDAVELPTLRSILESRRSDSGMGASLLASSSAPQMIADTSASMAWEVVNASDDEMDEIDDAALDFDELDRLQQRQEEEEQQLEKFFREVRHAIARWQADAEETAKKPKKTSSSINRLAQPPPVPKQQTLMTKFLTSFVEHASTKEVEEHRTDFSGMFPSHQDAPPPKEKAPPPAAKKKRRSVQTLLSFEGTRLEKVFREHIKRARDIPAGKHVLKLLGTDTQCIAFIGVAGTGKTHAVGTVEEIIMGTLGEIRDGTIIAACGFQGSVRATLMNVMMKSPVLRAGMTPPGEGAEARIVCLTLHSLLGIRPGTETFEDWDRQRKRNPVYASLVEQRAANLCLLVIDEIGLVDSVLLDLVDKIFRKLRRCPNLPFGGLLVVVMGDFSQLPPVCAKDKLYETSVWRAFNIIRFTEVYRSTGEFRDVLEDVRHGKRLRNLSGIYTRTGMFIRERMLSVAHQDELMQRCDTITVCYKNRTRIALNKKMMDLQGLGPHCDTWDVFGVEISMVENGRRRRGGGLNHLPPRPPDDIVESVLNQIRQPEGETAFCENTAVMCTTNLEHTPDYYNGALGFVVRMKYGTMREERSVIVMRAAEYQKRVPKDYVGPREKMRVPFTDRELQERKFVAEIKVVEREMCFRGRDVRVKFMPLVPSYARTVHSVQGNEFPPTEVKTLIIFGEVNMLPGGVYTAMSRVREGDQLRFAGGNIGDINAAHNGVRYTDGTQDAPEEEEQIVDEGEAADAGVDQAYIQALVDDILNDDSDFD